MRAFVSFVLAVICLALPGRAAHAESCEPTESDMLGPYYEPAAPVRTKVGEGHVLSGVVRSSRDCSPIKRARIEFWLVGPKGRYDDGHRAIVYTDESGAYRFESNFPPGYRGRPPHIHIRVAARGYRVLITQFYPKRGKTEERLDLVLMSE